MKLNINTTFDIGETVFAVRPKYIDICDTTEDDELTITEETISDIAIYIDKDNIYTEYILDNNIFTMQTFIEGTAAHINMLGCLNTLYKTYEDALEAIRLYNSLIPNKEN